MKKIDVNNWQNADEQSLLWMRMTGCAKTPEQWVSFFLRPKLKPTVPPEIVSLFEGARGSAVYGWFYYPLSTLAASQCWRVIESAVRLRCQQSGISTKRMVRGKEFDTKFSENISALVAKGVVEKQWEARLNAVRALRNSTSHPVRQMILDPGQAQGVFEMAAEFCNVLFE